MRETTLKFKVGDKVLISNCEGDPRYNSKVGVVIDIDRIKRVGDRWDYLCKFEDALNYPFGPPEMTKVYIKGQQLLFSFMK